MKSINWKIRFKKKSFWVAIISAIALFINNITQAVGLDYSSQVEQGVSILTSILTVLAGIGVVIDPTTAKLGDTGIAQTYSKPRDEKVTPERKELTPTEFDTSEPFTDDTDEVEFDVADYEYDEELKRGASRYHDDEVLKESGEDGR